MPAGSKVSCEDCFFKRNLLCALDCDAPCPTFRPDHPGRAAPAAAAALRVPPGAPPPGSPGRCPARRSRRRCTPSDPLRAGRGRTAHATVGSRMSEAHSPGQVALMAGRRRRLLRLSRRGAGLPAADGLRQRRLRQAPPLRGLRRRRRGGDLPSARRPLPRPRAVLVRAHLRAAPAARAGRRLARDERARAPRAARAARCARVLPPRGRRLGQRGPDRERVRRCASTTRPRCCTPAR